MAMYTKDFAKANTDKESHLHQPHSLCNIMRLNSR